MKSIFFPLNSFIIMISELITVEILSGEENIMRGFTQFVGNKVQCYFVARAHQLTEKQLTQNYLYKLKH